MRSIVIPVTGTCWMTPDKPDEIAKRELSTEMLTVVTARAIQEHRGLHVMYIDDWGAVQLGDRMPLPINRRAWALYGGSPIHGLAVLTRDDRSDIDPSISVMLNSGTFPGAIIEARMDHFLQQHPDA